jgi:hypothetical protein
VFCCLDRPTSTVLPIRTIILYASNCLERNEMELLVMDLMFYNPLL